MDIEKLYAEKCRTAAQLVSEIPDGIGAWMDTGLGQPGAIIEQIGLQNKPLTMHTMLDVYPMPWYTNEDYPGSGTSWFSSGYARKAVNSGFADVAPCYYRDLPRLLRERPEISCIMLAVSPMDKHGYFSLGLTASASADVISRVPYIFIEVNKQMPRSLNSPVIHISQVTALCESNYALPQAGKTVIDDVSLKIGNLIAKEVPDGATIQLGIGAIPDAVGEELKGKKHLGIHTELFTDSMVELIECGAVDNSKKPINTGKTVTTFAFGSQKMYDYIDDNPAVAILPVDYVNDPKVIALHPDFISVNSAVEVDFFGQVCAESVGTRHISGTGGQVDYVRGAIESKGGKSFIAFPSTAGGGKVSRIRASLTTGAVVTTSKNDVDNIVTEYGIACLRGKTLKERTRALIDIAHPDFRDELIYEAKQMKLI